MSKNVEVEKIFEQYKESIKSLEEHEKFIELYKAFKKLRSVLGKPVCTTIDPGKIREDLKGRAFTSLLQEIKKGRECKA